MEKTAHRLLVKGIMEALKDPSVRAAIQAALEPEITGRPGAVMVRDNIVEILRRTFRDLPSLIASHTTDVFSGRGE